MVYRSDENWFELPAGSYCGVYIKEESAKELQKLLRRQTQEIKDFLLAHKDDCAISHWTLAYPLPDKKPTAVYYSTTNPGETIERRIGLFDKTDSLHHIDSLFFTDKHYNEAAREVEAFYEEMYGDGGADDVVKCRS